MTKATGKDHAQINLDIWGDDDWLDLTPPAQHLYFVLWTSPDLNYCGCGPWHPGRISAKAKGWTPQSVEAAAVELSNELFLIVDTTTEEFLLRSWIKHDGLWKSPTMAVSMSNARNSLASRTLRAVVVHEVKKIKARNIAEACEEHPISKSWQRDQVINLLTQKTVDPSELPKFTPTLTPTPTPPLTPNSTPLPTVNGGVSVHPTADPPSTPAPTPATTSNSIKEGGCESGEPHQGQRPQCLRHPLENSRDRCDDCRRRREWDDAEAKRIADNELDAKRQLRELRKNCPRCKGTNLIEINDREVIKCDHHQEQAHA